MIRHKTVGTVFTGPPQDRAMDEPAVRKFMRRTGRLAVCGGTTAKIVARNVGLPLEVDLDTMTPEVPPKARIEGIDLVSEGILTLTKVSDLLRSGAGKDEMKFQTDGAAGLMRLMLEVDNIHFLVGTAVNPAHQNPDLPHQLGIHMSVVREIADELGKLGKEVTIEQV